MENRSKKAVIIDGLRTPFVKSFTTFKQLTALDLAKACISEMLQRTSLSPEQVNAIIYGQVVPSLDAPNIAREIAIGLSLSSKTDAFTINRACATSYQTTISAIQHIEAGYADCIIAGGADSISQAPLTVSDQLHSALLAIKENKNWRNMLKQLSGLSPSNLMPQFPAIKEHSTGLSMGESCEKMAKENGITRQEQDDYAYRSHQLAAKAWKDDKFKDEVMTLYPPPDFNDFVTCDSLVRFNNKREDYTKLKPSFDKKYGTLTAGNSSPLTDGASALLIMSETMANQLQLKPLGRIISYDFAPVDPFKQLLIGPIFAIPKALERAGITWEELDLIDMHEAFAAQILSVLKAFEDPKFAQEQFDLSGINYDVDMEKFNVNGGSIAMGHPFAATGARQILQTLHELKRRKKQKALCSACAAGGLSAAIILEAI